MLIKSMSAMCLWILLAPTADAQDCAREATGDDSPGQLRALAETCQSGELADLYYNRAYFLELIDDLQLYQRMDASVNSDDADAADVYGYRLYIAMVEQFARVLAPDERSRVRALNLAYERQIEIAELRLKGLSRQADALEDRF